jgi:UPF0042 nucleotide-binding protein
MEKLVVITGMSGAGKTVFANTLEELDYFVIDNLPAELFDKFIEMVATSTELEKIALVLHEVSYNADLLNAKIKKIKEEFNAQLIFLDASDEVLVSRYKETRRNHPYADGGSTLEGITRERELLTVFKDLANIVIDTSVKGPKELISEAESLVSNVEANFMIQFMSYGYKYGLPIDLDLAFDVRFLPNPHYIEELRPMTGLNAEVFNYVIEKGETEVFINHLQGFLDYIIPEFIKEGKRSVTVGIGCTGGKHRSVSLVEYFGKHYDGAYETRRIHRDIKRGR